MAHDDDDDVATKGFVREEIGKFEARVDQRFDALAAMIDANAKRVDEGFRLNDDRFTQIDDRFDRLETGLERQGKAIIEEMQRLLRGAGDKEKSLEERLDAHIADATVHVSAARGPRDRASRRPRRR